MSTPDDPIDDEIKNLQKVKLDLEIKKLEFESENRQYFPARWATYLQPLLPAIFTLASIIGTYVILKRTKFFENANNLYENKNLILKAEQKELEKAKSALDLTIKIKTDSISALADTITVYKATLSKTKNSMTDCQKQIANLTIGFNTANKNNGDCQKQIALLKDSTKRAIDSLKMYTERLTFDKSMATQKLAYSNIDWSHKREDYEYQINHFVQENKDLRDSLAHCEGRK
jgi:hypothetical protein